MRIYEIPKEAGGGPIVDIATSLSVQQAFEMRRAWTVLTV
jgi:hypothetical protein